MAARSLNKVLLIGNLTRDPEMRYTPQGTAVCQIGLATNRSWASADGGERQEETEYHKVVAWSKLAEICGQLLKKGRKVFMEGRLQTREWTDKEGHKRNTTEIIMENMILLDGPGGRGGETADVSAYAYPSDDEAPAKKRAPKAVKSEEPVAEAPAQEDVSDDIPF